MTHAASGKTRLAGIGFEDLTGAQRWLEARELEGIDREALLEGLRLSPSPDAALKSLVRLLGDRPDGLAEAVDRGSAAPALYRVLELAGAAYLAWLGFLLLRASREAANRKPTPSQHAPSQPSPNQTGSLGTGRTSPLSPGRQLLTGLGSALLNPKNAVFYLTLMTVILGPTATLPQQAFAGVWMTLLVFAWDAALAAAISLPGAQRALEKRIPLIEGLAGLTLASIALWLALRPLFD